MIKNSLAVGLAVCLMSFTGCTHHLRIKNLSDYRATTLNPLDGRVSIGIASGENDVHLKQLVRAVGEELRKYSDEVILPYYPGNGKPARVMADVNIFPEYRGAGTNFFVNFPGFLVWAPAWAGYKYRVDYLVSVSLLDVEKNQKFDQFELPIHLDIRQAELDRTWTEISWLEVGVIAFIGGIVFTQYDTDITPKVVQASESTIGDYVASEIIARINSSGRFS